MVIFIISIIWWVGSLFALILQLWNFRSSDDEEYEIGDEIITIEVRQDWEFAQNKLGSCFVSKNNSNYNKENRHLEELRREQIMLKSSKIARNL